MVLDITAWQRKGRCTRVWQIYECFSCCCPTVNLEVPPGTLTIFFYWLLHCDFLLFYFAVCFDRLSSFHAVFNTRPTRNAPLKYKTFKDRDSIAQKVKKNIIWPLEEKCKPETDFAWYHGQWQCYRELYR